MTYDISEFAAGRFNVADAIPYAQGEVVVKPIMKTGQLNVSVLALDKDAKVPVHQVTANVMALVLEGQVDFNVDGTPGILKKDQYVTMLPDTPHSLHALEPTKILLIRDYTAEK